MTPGDPRLATPPVDESTARKHRISYLLSNLGRTEPGPGADLNPFFFVGNGGLSPHWADPAGLVVLPVWPLMRDLPDVGGLADRLTLDLLRVRDRGPFLLGGYCFGGAIAYEMAVRLVASGHRVGFLGLVETACPGKSHSRLLLPRRALLAVHHPFEVVRFLSRRLFRTGGPPVGDPGRVPARDQYLRDYFESIRIASRGYRPRPYAGDVDLFFGNRSVLRFFPRAGWSGLVGGALRAHVVRGDHGQRLFENPDLAARLRVMTGQG